MREFIAALRQLRHPLVRLAASILLLQALMAGLASGHVAAHIATFGPDAVICHGNSEDGSAPVQTAMHDCCRFWTGHASLALPTTISVIVSLMPVRRSGQADVAVDVRRVGRAIRAGPSQAPPASV